MRLNEFVIKISNFNNNNNNILIKNKYIMLVEHFCKMDNKKLFLPKDILNIITFYYSKPLIINLINKQMNEIKFILYDPMEDSWNDIQQKVKLNNFIFYGDIFGENVIEIKLFVINLLEVTNYTIYSKYGLYINNKYKKCVYNILTKTT